MTEERVSVRKAGDKAAEVWESRRLRRERRTLEAMILLYCAGRHAGKIGRPCADCAELRDYALGRLRRCPHGD